VIALGGIPNKVQVGDTGVDGRIFPVGTKPTDKEGLFADDSLPDPGEAVRPRRPPGHRPFEAVMEREGGRQRGFLFSFSYGKDAEDECRAFYKRTKRIIKLLNSG
jgi:hypothetical protein